MIIIQIKYICRSNRAGFKWALLFLLFLLFSTFYFLCSYFSLLFSENALLSLLFSPKMFEVTKNCNFFPRSLCSLGVSKNQINLNWAATMQKFKNYFYFSCNSFFGTFILVFLFHGNVVLLFREKFASLYLSLSLKTLRTSLLSLLFYFSWLKFLLLPYFFKILSPILSLLFWQRALESLIEMSVFLIHISVFQIQKFLFIETTDNCNFKCKVLLRTWLFSSFIFNIINSPLQPTRLPLNSDNSR